MGLPALRGRQQAAVSVHIKLLHQSHQPDVRRRRHARAVVVQRGLADAGGRLLIEHDADALRVFPIGGLGSVTPRDHGGADERLLQVFRRRQFTQHLLRTGRNRAAPRHHHDVVAELGHFLHDVRGQDDAAAGIAQGQQCPAQAARAHHVQPPRGFVEDQVARIGQRGAGHRYLHALALRKAQNAAVDDVRQFEDAHGVVDARLGRRHRHAAQAGEIGQVFARGQAVVQTRLIGQETDRRPHRCRSERGIEPIDAEVAAIARHQAQQHAQQGGLAGPVGTEQAGDFSIARLERHLVQRADGSERLARLHNFYHDSTLDLGWTDALSPAGTGATQVPHDRHGVGAVKMILCRFAIYRQAICPRSGHERRRSPHRAGHAVRRFHHAREAEADRHGARGRPPQDLCANGGRHRSTAGAAGAHQALAGQRRLAGATGLGRGDGRDTQLLWLAILAHSASRRRTPSGNLHRRGIQTRQVQTHSLVPGRFHRAGAGDGAQPHHRRHAAAGIGAGVGWRAGPALRRDRLQPVCRGRRGVAHAPLARAIAAQRRRVGKMRARQPPPEPRMSITPQELELLMQEVEKEDPIDFADLPFEEEALRGLIANHLCDMADAMDNFSEEDKQLTLLAVAAKLVLENLVLHIQLLRRHGVPLSASTEALLNRLRNGKAD
uniref:Uncharacterized protein n=1 Tax=Tanacetum cinerariifolium TaxID=118510 RepID=A0A699GEM9_TANCI|nr:hypothetical protein [Tanacetum cinerariifolium]